MSVKRLAVFHVKEKPTVVAGRFGNLVAYSDYAALMKEIRALKKRLRKRTK